MSAIDVHAHAFPDKIAERAMQKLQTQGRITARGDGTIQGLLASMDRADIDVSVVCAIATKPDQTEGILKWCRKIHSDRIEPLASVHPDDPDAARWVARIAEAGLAGIKLHPMYQEFVTDEPRMDPIYAAAAEEGLLVVCHCGFDFAFPMDDDRASPTRYAHVADKFPDLRLVCTHLGGWRAWAEVEKSLLGRNVYLETSFSLADLGPARATDLMRRHGMDRVLFGTDWPWNDQGESLKALREVGLTEREISRITFRNAADLLGY